MSEKRTVRFVGGPLDGKSREIRSNLTIYEVDEPPPPGDIHGGELPVGFFPPFHRYIYEESPAGSGIFVLKQNIHS